MVATRIDTLEPATITQLSEYQLNSINVDKLFELAKLADHIENIWSQLSPLQQRMIKYLHTFCEENDGNTPTHRDYKRDLKISSTSVVAYNLDRLVVLGILKVNQLNRTRKYTFKFANWIGPMSLIQKPLQLAI